MKQITNLPPEAAPCDNYSECGNATDHETAHFEWSRGFENGERVVVCPACMEGL